MDPKGARVNLHSYGVFCPVLFSRGGGPEEGKEGEESGERGRGKERRGRRRGRGWGRRSGKSDAEKEKGKGKEGRDILPKALVEVEQSKHLATRSLAPLHTYIQSLSSPYLSITLLAIGKVCIPFFVGEKGKRKEKVKREMERERGKK